MSSPKGVRRTDRLMADDQVLETLARGFCGRIATVGEDGWPYVTPLLFVFMDGEILVHGTGARGHLRANIEHEARVCFEVDEPSEVFPYGRFECDTTVAYKSVIAFGRVRIVEDRAGKQAFCEALMAKYWPNQGDRPAGFFPRLDEITVYAIAIERITGKALLLPAPEQQWPALDRTKTPNARPE